jgi:hypothetical protein
MKGAIGLVIGLLVPALLAMSGSVAAQEKGVAAKVMTTKVLENDRVLVIENRFAPGAENANVPRNARVVRALTSGTLQRRSKRSSGRPGIPSSFPPRGRTRRNT